MLNPVAYRTLPHDDDWTDWASVEIPDVCRVLGKVWGRALQSGSYRAIEVRLSNGQVVRYRKRPPPDPWKVAYEDAVAVVRRHGFCNGQSWLQRMMGLKSWSLADTLIGEMVRRGVIRLTPTGKPHLYVLT